MLKYKTVAYIVSQHESVLHTTCALGESAIHASRETNRGSGLNMALGWFLRLLSPPPASATDVLQLPDRKSSSKTSVHAKIRFTSSILIS